jgi:hypothetical protein
MPKIIDTPELKRERIEIALATICVNAHKNMDYQNGVDKFFANLEGWVLECQK